MTGCAVVHLDRLIPAVASAELRGGELLLDPTGGRCGTSGADHERVMRLGQRTTERVATLTRGHGIELRLECREQAEDLPALGDDESYRLVVGAGGVAIRAPQYWGLCRGVETLLQLVDESVDGWRLPHVVIEDRPRFAWRGLLIDVCRHWIGPAALRRTLDAMAAVKLNVLHLHLTEDQAFRFECRSRPRLTALGSGGTFLTHDDIAVLVSHAASLGIRVVPEVDVPGHSTSWLVGHPELASKPGPHQLRQTFGIAEVALDPTTPDTDLVVGDVFDELAGLFPDEYVHIGGDEVAPAAWPGIADPATEQARFNQRLITRLRGLGKQVVGWDEVLHPDLPSGTVVQAWRSPVELFRAVRAGRRALLSAGWYLDHHLPAELHHRFEPLATPEHFREAQRRIATDPLLGELAPYVAAFNAWRGEVADEAPLTPAEQALVLGGEACLWSELVDERALDTRLWPRAGAVADRLWGDPVAIAQAASIATRTAALATVLETTTDVRPLATTEVRLRELVGERLDLLPALRTLAETVVPLPWYGRLFFAGVERSVSTPLDCLVDALPCDRQLPAVVDLSAADELVARWREAGDALGAGEHLPTRVAEVSPLAQRLSCAADVLRRVAEVRAAGRLLEEAEARDLLATLDACARPAAELVLAVAPPIRDLVLAATR